MSIVPNIFWLIALGQATFVVSVVLAGQVKIRGRILAERHIEPGRFWFYVAGFGAGLILVLIEAVYPPY